MCVCMYVSMYLCMYVSTYVLYIYIYVCMQAADSVALALGGGKEGGSNRVPSVNTDVLSSLFRNTYTME